MSALSDLYEKDNPTALDRSIFVCDGIQYPFISEAAAVELAELRRLVAVLTTLRVTRADIDAAKRILQKAEEE